MVSAEASAGVCRLQHWAVATAGEALIDLIGQSDGRFEPCLGGAVYNLSRALARQGVVTHYLNPLSADRLGRALAQGLREDGVHLACAEPVAAPTALAVVGLDAQGHPDYAFYREAVADRCTSAEQLTGHCAALDGLGWVCTGALALAAADAAIYLPWLEAQRRARRTVVIDANLRPSVMPDLAAYRSHVKTALHYADLIKVSDEDLEVLAVPGADALSRAQQLLEQSQAGLLALTLGAQGAWLLARAGWRVHCRDRRPLVVVDTVGAGDCFLAGLVAGHIEAGLWPDSVSREQGHFLLARAVASASLCVQRRGCQPPTAVEVLNDLGWIGQGPSEGVN